MLSYQHAYHAGNPADVHKHIALVLLLRSLQRKDTPLYYLDAHAGCGVYDLEREAARKTREAEAGIVRLAL
jgi:23S rRNA (adenine2030-N6)-methyltransferase